MALPNLGNTCYVNATVQVLRRLRCVVDTVPDAEGPAGRLVNLLFRGSTAADLRNVCSNVACFGAFAPGEQADAHEFYLGALGKLYEDCPFSGRLRSFLRCDCGEESVTKEPLPSVSVFGNESVGEALRDFERKVQVQASCRCGRKEKTKWCVVEADKLLVVHIYHTSPVKIDRTLRGLHLVAMIMYCEAHYTAVVRVAEEWRMYNDERTEVFGDIPEESQFVHLLFYARDL